MIIGYFCYKFATRLCPTKIGSDATLSQPDDWPETIELRLQGSQSL
jgi:hypothetical protein